MIHLALSAASALAPLLYAAEFVLLLAPGYALARALVRRWELDAAATPVLAFAFAALGGYAAFWCYFASPLLGRAVSVAWMLSACGAGVWIARRGIARDEAVPLALTFFAGLFYLAVLYLPAPAIGAEHRFFVARPDDNVLPQLFAERLYWGQDAHRLGDWLTSDRPPLQTGMLLLIRPLFALAPAHLERAYAIAALVVQLAWIPATWLLVLRAGLAPRGRALVLALAIFSGFCLYNSVYAWPKLLSAGFCIAALVFALPRSRAQRDPSLALAGVCAALAMLAHGSAAFFLIPALVLLLVLRRLPAGRGLLAAFVAAVVLLAPWSAYQRYYAPPGDRLLKMHLAGIPNADPRPAAEAIADAYERTPPADIASYKLANVRTALGAADLLGSAVISEPADALDRWRVREREHVTAALGAVNFGWLALGWWWLRPARDAGARRRVTALAAVAAVSLAFWSLAMWGPGGTVTTHGAYATQLLLFVVLGAALGELRGALQIAVLALALTDLVVTWIVGSLPDAWRVAPSLDPLMALLALAAAGALGATLVERPSAS